MAGTATSSDSSYSSFAISCYDPGTSRLPIQTQYDPPVMRIVVPDQATSGSLSLPTLAMFSCDIDPNTGSGYSYSIDWGDGSAPSGGTPTVGSPLAGSSLYVGSFGGSHTYTDPGVYYVLATVTAPGTGGSSTATMQVTVDSTTSLLTTSLPDASVNAGETYTLPNIAFTGLGIHTATVNWGDGTTDNATVVEPYMDDTLMATVPGSLTDSHIYSTSGSYPVTVTLTDDSGNTLVQPSPLNFTATVTAANVPLTSVSAAGNWLQVQYNVANAGSAPFPINIYSSTDGTTPDQLLTSYTVGGANGNDLTVGDHTALIAPPAGTPSGDYYLIASADSGAATSNNNTLALSGGTSFNAPQIIDTGNSSAMPTAAMGRFSRPGLPTPSNSFPPTLATPPGNSRIFQPPHILITTCTSRGAPSRTIMSCRGPRYTLCLMSMAHNSIPSARALSPQWNRPQPSRRRSQRHLLAHLRVPGRFRHPT